MDIQQEQCIITKSILTLIQVQVLILKLIIYLLFICYYFAIIKFPSRNFQEPDPSCTGEANEYPFSVDPQIHNELLDFKATDRTDVFSK